MATEVEYVNYKDFVAGLESTENPGVDDVTVVSNETDGPRVVPANTSALTNTATDSDLTAAASFELQTATGKKKVPANLLAKKSGLETANANATALTTYAQNVAHSIAPEFVPNETNAVAWKPYTYGGKVYIAKEDYSGAWDAGKFFEVNVEFFSRVIYAKISNDVSFVDDKRNWTKKTGYFLSSNGTTLSTCESDSSGWTYFTKQVSEGETYKITSWAGQLARLWFMFDALGNKIAQSADSSTASEKTEMIVIPAGVATLGVNEGGQLQTPPYSSEKIEKNIFTISDVHIRDSSNSNRLFGKTLVCCGDSITYGADMNAEGITQTSNIKMFQRTESNLKFEKVTSNFLHSYGLQIAERNNMLFYNDGISGSTLENIGSSKGFSVSNGRYTTLPSQIDYLTIWFGWNDNAYGTLGTINDNTNTTFYGAFNVVMPYLIDKYPFTKICLCVPFGSSAGMRQAVRDMGNKWGVAVFDFYGPQTPLYYGKEDSVGVDETIVSSNREKFQANGAHPNFKGHRQLADMLEAFLRTI